MIDFDKYITFFAINFYAPRQQCHLCVTFLARNVNFSLN